MNNEPVAWMLLRDESCVELTEWFGVMRGWEDFLGDNEKIVELYTHPSEHDLGIAEAIGFDKGHEAGRQLGMRQERALWELSASTQEIENPHPAKELTDEEIWKLWQQHLDDEIPVFARAILKKASEK